MKLLPLGEPGASLPPPAAVPVVVSSPQPCVIRVAWPDAFLRRLLEPADRAHQEARETTRPS
jgi:hypothetical protein